MHTKHVPNTFMFASNFYNKNKQQFKIDGLNKSIFHLKECFIISLQIPFTANMFVLLCCCFIYNINWKFMYIYNHELLGYIKLAYRYHNYCLVKSKKHCYSLLVLTKNINQCCSLQDRSNPFRDYCQCLQTETHF